MKLLEGMDWKVVSSSCVVILAVSLLLLLPRVTMGMRLTLPLRARMASLPHDVVKYSQVPSAGKTFTKTTIPQGLLRKHNTKQGTWGVINISNGRLKYVVDEGPHKGEYLLDETTKGVIEPRVYHSVAPISEEEDLSFVVEFYRLPGTGPVDEKRE